MTFANRTTLQPQTTHAVRGIAVVWQLEQLPAELVFRMGLKLNFLDNRSAIDVKVYRLYGSRVGGAAAGPFVTIILNNPLMLNVATADLDLLRHQTRECRGSRIQLPAAL